MQLDRTTIYNPLREIVRGYIFISWAVNIIYSGETISFVNVKLQFDAERTMHCYM